MSAIRALFALAVTAVATALLLAGLPLGAVALVGVAIVLRRAAEHGRLRRLPTNLS